MRVKIENGNIEIDIRELFDNLTDEELDELAEIYAWKSKLWENITKIARSNWCAPNVNSDIYKLRKMFFLMDLEGEYETEPVLPAMQRTMKYFIEENAELEAKARKNNEIRGELFRYVANKYDADTAYDINSKFLDLEHGNRDAESIEDKPPYIQKSEMVRRIEFENFIDEWVRKITTTLSQGGKVKEEE